jgi:hypothetical protein
MYLWAFTELLAGSLQRDLHQLWPSTTPTICLSLASENKTPEKIPEVLAVTHTEPMKKI